MGSSRPPESESAFLSRYPSELCATEICEALPYSKQVVPLPFHPWLSSPGQGLGVEKAEGLHGIFHPRQLDGVGPGKKA